MLYLCAVNELAMTYQTAIAQQRNFNFFAFFSALYLVVSEILLTHTHTHTHTFNLASQHAFTLMLYAREKHAITPIDKGHLVVSFVVLFYVVWHGL